MNDESRSSHEDDEAFNQWINPDLRFFAQLISIFSSNDTDHLETSVLFNGRQYDFELKLISIGGKTIDEFRKDEANNEQSK